MTTECPRCRRNTVETLATSAKCSTCGWEGPRCFGEMWDKTDPKCAGGADPTYWVNSTHVRPKCSYGSECQVALSKGKEAQVIPAQSIANKPWQNVEVRTAPAMPPKQLMPPTTATPTAMPTMPTMNAAPRPMVTSQPAGMSVQMRQQTVQVTPAVQQPTMTQQTTQMVSQQFRQAQPPIPLHQQVQHMQQMQHQQMQPQVHMPVAGAPMAWVPPQSAAMPAYVPQNYPTPGSQMPGYLTVPESANNGLAPMFFNSCMRAALKGAFHTAANLMDHVPWG